MMINWAEWWPYLAIAAVPGVFNAMVAFAELSKACRSLIYFKPLRNPGVWLWIAVQCSFPAVSFWFFVDLSSQPDINTALIVKVTGFGFGFAAALNGQLTIASERIDIKTIYAWFIKVSLEQIAKRETRRSSKFWDELEELLLQPRPEQLNHLNRGAQRLVNYFRDDKSLSMDEQKRYQEKLSSLKQITDVTAKVTGIIGLMREIRPQDLPDILEKLGCDSTFIQRYFKPSQLHPS